MICGKFLKKYKEIFYLVFRVMVGLLMMQHGLMKVFGLFGGTALPLFSLMGAVGVVELFGGLAIALGMLTRLAAAGNAIIMVAGYFMAHFKFNNFVEGWIPVLNGGELALLYLACFIWIMYYGSGKLGLEKALTKKELF